MSPVKKLILLFVFLAVHVKSQSNSEQYSKALGLKKEHRFAEALAVFKQLLKTDSNQVDYLTNTAFLLCKVGNREKQENNRQHYFQTASYLSKKAIALNHNDSQAHFTYALALGRSSEFASSKQKVANAKEIKAECDIAIQLDPNLAGAYHILGRWHRTIADFNFIERAAINALYGGMPPGGSIDAAIDCFSKAMHLDPGNLLNCYELAVSYHQRGKNKDDSYAKAWLKEALKLPVKDEDEAETKKKCEELLKKID